MNDVDFSKPRMYFINCHPEDIVYKTLLCIRDVNVGKRGDVPFALAHKPFTIAP